MLCDLHKTDPSLHAELMQQRTRCLQAPVLTDQEAEQEDTVSDGIVAGDDSDVPLQEVISYCDDVAASPDKEDLVHIYVAGEDGGLSSAAEAEDTHIEIVEDKVTDVSGAFTGCAKWIRRSNVLYSGKEWLNSDDVHV